MSNENLNEIITDKETVIQAFNVCIRLSEIKMVHYKHLTSVWRIRDELLENRQISNRDLQFLHTCSLLTKSNCDFFGVPKKKKSNLNEMDYELTSEEANNW